MAAVSETSWGFSNLSDSEQAGSEAVLEAVRKLGHADPEFALVLISPEYDPDLIELTVRQVLPITQVVVTRVDPNTPVKLAENGVLISLMAGTKDIRRQRGRRRKGGAPDDLCTAKQRKAFGELSAVHMLGNLLNSSLELKNVIQQAVDVVGELLGADGAGLLIADIVDGEMKFSLTAFYGPFQHSAKAYPEIFRGSLPYHSLLLNRPLITGDAPNCSYISQDLNRVTGAKTIMAVPVTSKGKKIGALSVYSSMRDYYTKDDLRFLGILSNQIGIAVRNAELFHKTQSMAHTDGLTELYNHNYFLKYLDNLITDAGNTQIALIIVDLDCFKCINEQFGHKTGDQILMQTAGLLRSMVAENTMVARYGGDEFALVLPHVSKCQGMRLAEEIRKSVASFPFVIDGQEVIHRLTASIGVASYPADGSTAMALIDKANRAMYRVKRSAGNRVEAYLSELRDMNLTDFDQAFLDIIRVLVDSLDSRDRYTWEHSRQVAHYAAMIAEEMGLSVQETELIRCASYLHDLGKIHLDYTILNKPKRLTKEEFRAVKLHPEVGANLLSPIQGFAPLVPLVLFHHEWFNGRGYPHGLTGDDIPLGARIIAVADGFDAMTSNRPYRRAMGVDEALATVVAAKGTQYDPAVVDVLVKVIALEKIENSNIG